MDVVLLYSPPDVVHPPGLEHRFVNCTFRANDDWAIGRFTVPSAYHAFVENSVLWDDGPGEIDPVGHDATVLYSNVEGGFTGEGNIDVDPIFVDADEGLVDNEGQE